MIKINKDLKLRVKNKVKLKRLLKLLQYLFKLFEN